MSLLFPGVIPAVLTPFDDRHEIDSAKLKAHTEFMIEGGVHGLVAVGTMGEAPSMSRDERQAVTRIVVDQAGGRIPVLAGVSAPSAKQAVEYCEDAAEVGVKGVMLLPPLLYDADYPELLDFYREVDRGTELPIMLYNNPKASGTEDLSAETIASLVDDVSGIAAVKECSGDARRIAALQGADAEILIGGDDWALEGFFAGSTGWVSGVANVAPRECVRLYEECRAGDIEAARQTYQALLPLSRLDMSSKLVQYFKSAARHLGMDLGGCRPPRLVLNAVEEAEVAACIKVLESLASPAVSTGSIA